MTTASIVLYNTPQAQLLKVLTCIGRSPIDYLYLIDNSPTDTLRSFSTDNPNCKYIFNNANLGYGAAHNIALQEAMMSKAKYHIVLNADVYFEAGVIAYLTEYMDNHPGVGQVMPKVFYPDGSLQYTCKLLPTPLDLILKRFFPLSFAASRMRKFQLRFTNYDRMMNVPYLHGCFMFFRVPALQEVGTFDERFFMYPEDIDMTRRMHEKYETIFNPNVSITHEHAAASYKSSRMLWIHVVNMVRYFNKWGWVFDKKRRAINQDVLKALRYDGEDDSMRDL